MVAKVSKKMIELYILTIFKSLSEYFCITNLLLVGEIHLDFNHLYSSLIDFIVPLILGLANRFYILINGSVYPHVPFGPCNLTYAYIIYGHSSLDLSFREILL
jgi:hypothetical protein